MSYINPDDLKASVAIGFDLEPYLEEADGEINDLAQRNGIFSSDIQTNPLHYKVKRYGVVYILMRLCQDKLGTNNTDIPDIEKYMVLYGIYLKELEKLKSEISVEMMTGEVDEQRDRAIMSSVIYRG
jgi:hypothetical protein